MRLIFWYQYNRYLGVGKPFAECDACQAAALGFSPMSGRRGGHYCWACDRARPNERFSGRGHARHICRDCAKLGKEELAYRQGVRVIDRLARHATMSRQDRKTFASFLRHPNPRLRPYAAKIRAALFPPVETWAGADDWEGEPWLLPESPPDLPFAPHDDEDCPW